MKERMIEILRPDKPLPEAFFQVRKRVYGNPLPNDHINSQYHIASIIVWQHQQLAGRLCLYYNEAIDNGKTLLFGNLEFMDEEETFGLLMQAVDTYAAEQHFTSITGPMNGSTWDDYRLPISNFGVQFFTDLPQPEYYQRYLLQCGYAIGQRYYTQRSRLAPQATDACLSKTLLQQGITIRSINLSEYENELRQLYGFCAVAFEQNVYYSAVSESEFIARYKKIQPFLHPDFVLIAEDSHQQVVAFILCIPDVFHAENLVMKTIARSNKTELRGLMTHLINLLHNQAAAAGFTWLIHAFFHETNRSKLLSEKYKGERLKEYALFTKKAYSNGKR